MDIEQLAGTKLGNYEIESLLGRGGMSVVYKARQVNLDRPVALKILPPTLSSDPSFVKRFEREACAIAALNHPNIVQIYDVGQDEYIYYYAMEFMDGTSLDNLLFQRGSLPLERAVNIVAKVAKALGYMHRRGIIHRDIKPSNIMIDALGIVKVTDFGLALQERTQRLTADGSILGTLEYMSPEQASGETATALSDIYSLGAAFYELLTGRMPFEADTPLGVIKKIQTEEPAPPRSINSQIPPGAEKIILKMMAKNPKKRYPNCRAVRADLRWLRTGEPASALVPNMLSTRNLAIGAVAILLLVALIGGGAYIFMQRTPSEPPEPVEPAKPTEPKKPSKPLEPVKSAETQEPDKPSDESSPAASKDRSPDLARSERLLAFGPLDPGKTDSKIITLFLNKGADPEGIKHDLSIQLPKEVNVECKVFGKGTKLAAEITISLDQDAHISEEILQSAYEGSMRFKSEEPGVEVLPHYVPIRVMLNTDRVR